MVTQTSVSLYVHTLSLWPHGDQLGQFPLVNSCYYIYTSTALDLATITRKLKTVAQDWYELGVQLGIEPHTLKQIESDHQSKGVRRLLSEMVTFWLDNCENKSWTKIAAALRKIGQCKLAAKIGWYDGQGELISQ